MLCNIFTYTYSVHNMVLLWCYTKCWRWFLFILCIICIIIHNTSFLLVLHVLCNIFTYTYTIRNMVFCWCTTCSLVSVYMQHAYIWHGLWYYTTCLSSYTILVFCWYYATCSFIYYTWFFTDVHTSIFSPSNNGNIFHWYYVHCHSMISHFTSCSHS